MDPNRPYPPQQNYQAPYGAPHPYGPLPNNGKAIAALVLGIASIVSLMFLPVIGAIIGILAIIFGIIALKELQYRQENGKGMAIGGLVCGIVGTLLHILFLLFILFAIGVAVDESYQDGSDYWEPTFEQNSDADFY